MSIVILGRRAAAAPPPPPPPAPDGDCITPVMTLDLAITVTFTGECE